MPSLAPLLENFSEIPEPTPCEIKGEVPKWLKGTLLRNGPGKFSIGNTEFHHWFDGCAYIQRYHFEDGKVHFNAKFLNSDSYEKNMKANAIVSNEFGTTGVKDPSQSALQRFLSFFSRRPVTDNALVNFLQCGDTIYATTETPSIHELDIDMLKSLQKVDVNKSVNIHSMTAHQHYDEEGNIYNIGTQYGLKSKYVFFKTPNPKLDEDNKESKPDFTATTVLGQIEASENQGPAYYHSFAITSNFIILFESSLRMNALSLIIASFTSKSFKDFFNYTPGQETVVRIFNRITGKELDVQVKSPAFFTFHHANAYEHENHLVIDYSRHEKVAAFDTLTLENMRKNAPINADDSQRPFFHRMIIPLEIPEECAPGTDLLEGKQFASKCSFTSRTDGTFLAVDERLCDISFEFPRYNYDAFNMKPYRFVYGADLQSTDSSLHGLIKLDVNSRSTKIWDRDNENQLCSEPVFVPTPGAVEEDDGIVLCPILTLEEGAQPFLLILNAVDMNELARCYINNRLPLSFHGHFVHPFKQ